MHLNTLVAQIGRWQNILFVSFSHLNEWDSMNVILTGLVFFLNFIFILERI
jgi:hypothetical protein